MPTPNVPGGRSPLQFAHSRYGVNFVPRIFLDPPLCCGFVGAFLLLFSLAHAEATEKATSRSREVLEPLRKERGIRALASPWVAALRTS
ncbi:MAG: hypothetical protein EBZ48_00555 [Proteobacteria bacterium]|nr:hypothetical protein [Pseudomonadota bacterium]